MLIHFPSAFFPMDLICSILAICLNQPILFEAGYCALVAGAIMGWLAIVAGSFDLIGVMKNKPGAMKKALVHGGINTFVLGGFSILTFMAAKDHAKIYEWGTGVLFIKATLVLIMIIGNFLGGNLILKEKVLEETDPRPTFEP